MIQELTNELTKVKSSSVLNKSAEFKAANVLIDDESCWNSDADKDDQGQYLILNFNRSVIVKEIILQFQGGFVGENCNINIANDLKLINDSTNIIASELSLEDNNESQSFKLDENNISGKYMKIIFNNITDMFGRITMYRLNVKGIEIDE